MNDSVTSYAQHPYRTLARKECDTARMAAIARLHGLNAALPSASRVLEIGCGSGGNIIPLAERYPQSTFVGIDAEEAHIAEARRETGLLGITNVEWVCADLRRYNPGRGEWDYVLAHGVYSWVSADVQARLLALCRSALSAEGVALVSFNVLPGWRQRGAVRDIMRVGARLAGGLDGAERLQSALALLKLVGSVRKSASDSYGSYIRESVSRLSASDPSYLIHEFLADYNEPELFADFMQSAAREGLQFLSEAKISMMSADDLGPDVASVLRQLEGDIVAQEQVLDLCRNRAFRETMLCHDGLTLTRGLKAAVFESLTFRTTLRPQGAAEGGQAFTDLVSGRALTVPSGAAADVLAGLAGSGPFGATPGGLLGRIGAAAPQKLSHADVTSALVSLWRAGFVEAVCDGTPASSSGFAKALSIARLQAERALPATSFRHEALPVSAVERELLCGADGSFGRADSVAAASKATGCALEQADAAYERLAQLGYFCAGSSERGG